MALTVVVSKSEFQPDASRGVVVIESDIGPPFTGAFDELQSLDAVKMAQQYAAAKGCSPPMVNGNKIGPYAITAEGLSLDQVKDKDGNVLPQSDPRMQPAKFRLDVPMARSIR